MNEAAFDVPMRRNFDDEQEDNADSGIRIGDIFIPPPPLPALTFDATGPRLRIVDIVIENFKSYGGKVNLGPFQKNFSAIIGANGSGKSNVIDAMLFVFGYRAQKIRSKTVGVLIHNSDSYPNLTQCSVSVHFQKIIDKSSEEFDVVDGSNFVVSRTAHKDNSSYYAIDGRRVQFKEVSLLLKSHGIDLDHNRFLILQGEVEQISLMKPKAQTEHDTGMLEFLEDIIGSGRFELPIKQLARKVEELSEQRGEKLNRVKAVEKEKDALEEGKNEAVEYLTAKNEATKKENVLLQRYIYDIKVDMEMAVAKKKETEEGITGLLEKCAEIDLRLNDKNSKLDIMIRKRDKARKRTDDLDTKFSDIEKQDARGRQDLKHANTRAKELTRTIAKDRAKLEELMSAPERLENEIKELETRREKLETEKTKAEKKFQDVMASLHLETKSLQEEKDVHESELMKLQTGVNDARSRMDLAQVELDLCLKGENDQKNKLEALQKNYETILETMKERSVQINTLTETVPILESSIAKSNRELQDVTLQENSLSEQLREQRMKVEEAKMSMQVSQGWGSLIEALMKEKSSGRIPGIIGRLGDLGAIDEKYDVAISTACGQLNNIVTDNLDTAQKCVELLKRDNLGRATFIALDKMHVWQNSANRKIKTPEDVPRLFDLIKVKEKSLLPAFYFALRDTLVANDINQATRIGLQGSSRHRVVTLKGELIEISGAMSGGGSRPISGRMGTAVVAETCTREQVDEMTRQCMKLEENVRFLRQRKIELEELIVVQRKEADEAKHTLQKFKMELEALTNQEPNVKANVREQKDRVAASAADKQKVHQLTKKLDELKLDFNVVDGEANAVRLKVDSINDEIKSISEGRMNAAQKFVDDVNKTVDNVEGMILKNKVAIKSTARNRQKIEEKIEHAEIEVTENTEKIARLHKELKDAEGLATKIMDEIKQKKIKIEDLEKHIGIFQKELQVIDSQKAEVDGEKLEVNHKLQQLDIQVKEYQGKINTWKRQLSKLHLEHIDDVDEETLPILNEVDLANVDREAVKFQQQILQSKLRDMKPNLASIKEYKRKEQLYLERVNELDKITLERETQRHYYDDLRKQRLNEFMTGFQIITHKLKETYQMLTLGGDAELELVNSLDPFSDGIVFSVRPPRKSWKNISNLSGGEKTLSSLALVFALHYYKPAPFYVMDEIDAALDFRNVTIVGHYIKEQTKNAQFIVISLRNYLFELADRLIGVFKTHNTSHSVTINPSIGQEEEEEDDDEALNA